MKHALVILAVGLTSLIAKGQTPTQAYTQLFENPKNFQAVCSYDSACSKVGRITRGQFVIKRPRPELITLYAPLRELIIQIAQQYHVDPVAVVGAPLAENTMNVNIVDDIQDDMEEKGMLDDDGKVTGALSYLYDKPMSVGPGQIYVYAANNVEKLAASVEGRPVRTKKEIKLALKTRQGALRYAAAILLDAQQIYGQGGVDISHRPDLLATLYNIGKVKMRFQNSRNTRPSPNYFGYWVGANYEYIKEALQLPSVLDQH